MIKNQFSNLSITCDMTASHRAVTASAIKKNLGKHPWRLSVVHEMCRIYLLTYLRQLLKMNLSVSSQIPHRLYPGDAVTAQKCLVRICTHNAPYNDGIHVRYETGDSCSV